MINLKERIHIHRKLKSVVLTLFVHFVHSWNSFLSINKTTAKQNPEVLPLNGNISGLDTVFI